MAGIFQNGVFSMGFDMDPTGTAVFTQASHGSASSTTPFGFGYSWSTGGAAPGILLGTNLTSIIVGFACNIQTYANPTTICVFYDVTGGATQLSLAFTNAGALQFYRNGTAVGPASAAGTFVISTWYYIECAVTISSSSGSVQCNVNGVPAIAYTTGLNTQYTANAYVNAFLFQGFNASFFDDWYMLDTTASAPLNAMLGPVQVRGQAPSATSAVTGGRNNFSATGGTALANVQNVPANGSDYNADSTVGDFDQYAFPSLPSATTSVFWVNTWADLLLDSAGTRTVSLNQCAVSGGTPTDNLSTAFQPGLSAGLYNEAQITDPHGAAWTPTSAAALEMGVKVIS